MRESTRNFLVGLASIVALLGLAGLLMAFGELDRFINPRYAITIHTDNAYGLRAGSTVEHRGVPIGFVHRIVPQPDPEYPVRIALRIDENVRLPDNVQAQATVPLLGAGAILQFRPIDRPMTGHFPTDGTAEIHQPMRGGMFAEITEQLDSRMEPLYESLRHFNRLSETFVTLGENMNDLLIPQTREQLAEGASPNFRTAVARLNTVLHEAERGLELANSFLGDEQIRADARHAVSRAAALIDQATAAVENYAQLARTLQHDAGEITQRLLPVMDSMASTLEEVRRVAAQANQGQGTIGHLLNNPDLYNALTDAATRLDRTLVELQVLIQQLRAEGFILSF